MKSILNIEKNQTVLVSFESIRDQKYKGKVISVYPRDSQFMVRIELDTWPKGILPGMTADVAIIIRDKKNIVMIPVQSISEGKVQRLRDGKKEKIAVELGIVDGDWAEVISNNLQKNDFLLIKK